MAGQYVTERRSARCERVDLSAAAREFAALLPSLHLHS
jgi:hypothetical protein